MCCCRCCSTPASPRRRSQHAFTIDDVADALVRKLGNRVPAVLAGESISLEDQLAQWEERKALEKAATESSCMDDMPTGQPALALGAEGDCPGADRGPARGPHPGVDHDRARWRPRRMPKTSCAQWFWSSWTPCAPSSGRSRRTGAMPTPRANSTSPRRWAWSARTNGGGTGRRRQARAAGLPRCRRWSRATRWWTSTTWCTTSMLDDPELAEPDRRPHARESANS